MNYIYDAQQENKNGTGAATPIQRMETVAKFITFGCNIPVFVFAYPESDVRPIAYPGSKLPTRLKMKPWWYNYFDRDDVLGFPLRDVSPDTRRWRTITGWRTSRSTQAVS